MPRAKIEKKLKRWMASINEVFNSWAILRQATKTKS